MQVLMQSGRDSVTGNNWDARIKAAWNTPSVFQIGGASHDRTTRRPIQHCPGILHGIKSMTLNLPELVAKSGINTLILQ